MPITIYPLFSCFKGGFGTFLKYVLRASMSIVVCMYVVREPPGAAGNARAAGLAGSRAAGLAGCIRRRARPVSIVPLPLGGENLDFSETRVRNVRRYVPF